ncbi:hypothetical protein LIER_28413 [Lithospermum erythrorhizon]|uniref:Uncharacterized protein n=1 Tax=Lithospermum erythrorhizon TaxID=34254 RepID=A0AAV3RJ12_LITER
MAGSRRWMYERRNSDGSYNEKHFKGEEIHEYPNVVTSEYGAGSSNVNDEHNNEFLNMVEDVLGIHDYNDNDNHIDEDHNITIEEYYRLLEEANEPLWDGCTTSLI